MAPFTYGYSCETKICLTQVVSDSLCDVSSVASVVKIDQRWFQFTASNVW